MSQVNKFHGTAMTLTNHITHDKMRKDPPPFKLGLLAGVHIQFPGDYAIAPHIDEYAGDVTRLGAVLPQESWLQDAYKVVERNDWQNTYHLFWVLFSQPAIRRYQPRVNGWVFPIFYEKAASIAMRK